MTDLIPRNEGETLEETFEKNDKEQVKKLQERIKELETVNSVLVAKVQHYENMNVVKAIMNLNNQYNAIEKKLQETEDRLKRAQAFFNEDGNAGLNGNFANNLERALSDQEKGKNPDLSGFGSALGGLASIFLNANKNSTFNPFNENSSETKKD